MRLNDLSKQKNPFTPEVFITKLQDFITFIEDYKNSEAMRTVDTQKMIIFISYLKSMLHIERRRQEIESV